MLGSVFFHQMNPVSETETKKFAELLTHLISCTNQLPANPTNEQLQNTFAYRNRHLRGSSRYSNQNFITSCWQYRNAQPNAGHAFNPPRWRIEPTFNLET
jgi:hypothetical protein